MLRHWTTPISSRKSDSREPLCNGAKIEAGLAPRRSLPKIPMIRAGTLVRILGIMLAAVASPARAANCEADASMVSILAAARIHHPQATERGIVDAILLAYGHMDAPSWFQLRLYHLLDFAEEHLGGGTDGAQAAYREFCKTAGPILPVGPD